MAGNGGEANGDCVGSTEGRTGRRTRRAAGCDSGRLPAEGREEMAPAMVKLLDEVETSHGSKNIKEGEFKDLETD